jgi:hypothetical protein
VLVQRNGSRCGPAAHSAPSPLSFRGVLPFPGRSGANCGHRNGGSTGVSSLTFATPVLQPLRLSPNRPSSGSCPVRTSKSALGYRRSRQQATKRRRGTHERRVEPPSAFEPFSHSARCSRRLIAYARKGEISAPEHVKSRGLKHSRSITFAGSSCWDARIHGPVGRNLPVRRREIIVLPLRCSESNSKREEDRNWPSDPPQDSSSRLRVRPKHSGRHWALGCTAALPRHFSLYLR